MDIDNSIMANSRLQHSSLSFEGTTISLGVPSWARWVPTGFFHSDSWVSLYRSLPHVHFPLPSHRLHYLNPKPHPFSPQSPSIAFTFLQIQPTRECPQIFPVKRGVHPWSAQVDR